MDRISTEKRKKISLIVPIERHVKYPPAIEVVAFPVHAAAEYSAPKEKRCFPSGCFKVKQVNKTCLHVPYDPPSVGLVPFAVPKFEKLSCLPSGYFKVKQGNKTCLHVPYDPPCVGLVSFPVHATTMFSSFYTERPMLIPSRCFTLKHPAVGIPPSPVYDGVQFSRLPPGCVLSSHFKEKQWSSLPSTNMEKPSKTRGVIKLEKLWIRQMWSVKNLRIRQTCAKKQFKKSHQGNGLKKPLASKDSIVHEKICIEVNQPKRPPSSFF